MGVNCSLGPEDLYDVIEELAQCTDTPIVVKPNAGLPDPVTNEYNVSPKEFAGQLTKFSDYGVKILGGCCGTTPEYIKCLKNDLKNYKYEKNVHPYVTSVSSGTTVVEINQPRIIGERINPTGKKRKLLQISSTAVSFFIK